MDKANTFMARRAVNGDGQEELLTGNEEDNNYCEYNIQDNNYLDITLRNNYVRVTKVRK